MKKRNLSAGYIFLFVAAVFMLESKNAIAQTIPPFRMQLTSGQIFTSKNLSKEKPAIIIYFAPDCEHCQALIHGLLQRVNNFKNVQIILVSFEPLSMVINFERDYHLSPYSNIKCGTEIPAFYFKNLFNLNKTPFTVLYDKKGKLIISYQNETPLDDLIKHLNRLF
jgi:thiol-disulfide isomerase/thioredoxin